METLQNLEEQFYKRLFLLLGVNWLASANWWSLVGLAAIVWLVVLAAIVWLRCTSMWRNIGVRFRLVVVGRWLVVVNGSIIGFPIGSIGSAIGFVVNLSPWVGDRCWKHDE